MLSAIKTVVARLAILVGLTLAHPAISSPKYTRDESLSENEDQHRPNEGKYQFTTLEYVYIAHLSVLCVIHLYKTGKFFLGDSSGKKI
jgi:hypothetical protein